MSGARDSEAGPEWAPRPGEGFADYLRRFMEDIESPEENARAEGLARMDRELGPPPDAVDASNDASEP